MSGSKQRIHTHGVGSREGAAGDIPTNTQPEGAGRKAENTLCTTTWKVEETDQEEETYTIGRGRWNDRKKKYR